MKIAPILEKAHILICLYAGVLGFMFALFETAPGADGGLGIALFMLGAFVFMAFVWNRKLYNTSEHPSEHGYVLFLLFGLIMAIIGAFCMTLLNICYFITGDLYPNCRLFCTTSNC
ncbi:hypothetical protein AGMMS50229_03020 [Campylobacterota bacterium]|nr:hypothetical protein AGMMS50229_03020 [Campylobacterota bacterium]